MSRNLIKQYNAVDAEETRIIDTNELLRRRGETVFARKASETEGEDVGFGSETETAYSGSGEEHLEGAASAGEVVQAMLDQAREEADALLNQARGDAAAIMEDAKKQAEAEKKRVYDQARQQGYEEGQAKARAEADGVKREFQEKTRQLEAEYQQMMEELEPKFVDTIASIYEHIFQVDLSSDRDLVCHLISNTLHRLEGGGSYLIHVSREDYDTVSMQKDRLVEGTVSGAGSVEIVEDATLGKNQCMIETDSGIFDCGLGTQLAGLKQKLMLLAWSKEE